MCSFILSQPTKYFSLSTPTREFCMFPSAGTLFCMDLLLTSPAALLAGTTTITTRTQDLTIRSQAQNTLTLLCAAAWQLCTSAGQLNETTTKCKYKFYVKIKKKIKFLKDSPRSSHEIPVFNCHTFDYEKPITIWSFLKIMGMSCMGTTVLDFTEYVYLILCKHDILLHWPLFLEMSVKLHWMKLYWMPS